MMLLHRDGRREAAAIHVIEDNAAPAGASWEAARISHARLAELPASVGLALDNTLDVTDLPVDPQQFAFVALEFPTFADGRAYSQARLLRERCAYRGPLVATGEILRDQAFYMLRCGFDVFAVADERAADVFSQGMTDFSLAYQPTAFPGTPIHPFRRQRV